MPRPTDAGVLGMARTMDVSDGSSAAMPAIVLPAMIETASVPGSNSGATDCSTSFHQLRLDRQQHHCGVPKAARVGIDGNAGLGKFRPHAGRQVGDRWCQHFWGRAQASASPPAWRRPSCPRPAKGACRRYREFSSRSNLQQNGAELEPGPHVIARLGNLPGMPWAKQ